MLLHLGGTASDLGRPELAAAVRWLAEHRPATDSDVLCHGDMHPFNVLLDDGGRVTVLDWSAAVVAPRTYDLGFTSLMLAEPPLVAPRALRPLIRLFGRTLSRRFVKAYEKRAALRIDPDVLAWHQGLICVRALTEVAGWAVAGSLIDRGGHPWVINQEALINRLRTLTGISVPAEGGAVEGL
jgi:aminoglycoside phosphotransferase (APT) family kinase protein